MKTLSLVINLAFIFTNCASYKILAIFPYNGRSHHIYYSSLVEELATRKHDVTVINYFPVKKLPNLRQISLLSDNTCDFVNIEEYTKGFKSVPSFLKDLIRSYDNAEIFQYIANTNCEMLMTNKEIRDLINSGQQFDLVIAEQFVTDCGLALAHKLKVPVVGITAHVLMSWTYSRLGATNNPSFVPNAYFNCGSKPDIWKRLQSAIINCFLNLYYEYVIQRNDYDIVKRVYPETPDLELLGRNISLILLNQYFPLTGSRIYGANIIEVGGLHIKQTQEPYERELENFLNSAGNGCVYISFGSVANNFPRYLLEEILKVIHKSNMKFLWKVDDENLKVPKNTIKRKWLPQTDILRHPNVKAFVSHSGMLSSSEAMHYGVPIVSVPLFGDQFANAESAVENGLGVMIDIETLDEKSLTTALDTVMQDRYQNRAKQLSQLWQDRPMSPMDTAIFWIEYVARHKSKVNLRPPTVDLPLYQYLMLDIISLIFLVITFMIFVIFKVLRPCIKLFGKNDLKKESKKKKNK